LKTDLTLRLENLQSEIRSLSTGIEEYKELLKRPPKEMDRFKEDMEGRWRGWEERRKTQEERIKEIEDRLKGLDGKTAGSTSKPMESERLASTKEAPTELKGVSTGMGDIYKDAYETFHKGDLEGARRKFEAFLKQYPNTELSDNAQYWIGETYYLKKDFERSILEYEKAIVKYPEGDKIPAALFKQALAFLELGDKANARNLLKRVIEKYPRSEQAEMAKKKLETIK
jgi:tol-pal system protein YbgF